MLASAFRECSEIDHIWKGYDMNVFLKRLGCAVLIAVTLTGLYGCQQAPAAQSVISKNDGSFDSSVIAPATEDPAVGSTQAAVYTDEFTSTDKSVTFTYNIDGQHTVVNNPVVEVVPHYLTAEDAKRVATALLGDVDWLEKEPYLEPEYTKEQIQNKINRWSQYANTDAILKLLGTDSGNTVDVIKNFIEEYSNRYETAPSDPPKMCEWTLKKDSYYYYSAESLAERDLSEDNDSIQAVAKVGEVEYTFSVSTRNESDYKMNFIYLYPGEGSSPCSIDSNIYQATLCRTEKPTEEDISIAVAKAEKMLADMDLGQWQVDSSTVQTTYFGDTPEYRINVTAVPVINGIPAVRVPQISNLKSDLAYASNYYMTDANFEFSANGDMVRFKMYAPIDTKEIINENVAAKSLDELMELAKNHLTLSDYYKYGLSADTLDNSEGYYGENLTCQIDICQMEYGMLRVKVPNTDESYYYVPGIVLSGSVDYIGRETGTVFAASGQEFRNARITPIVAINAVDGSNIELYIS